MQVLHVSTECYPIAKSGGLGDVVGALPKYLNKAGIDSSVILPKYDNKWISKQIWITCFKGVIQLDTDLIAFKIQQLKTPLAFPLYVVDIPGKYDRPGIYLDHNGMGYEDATQRAICFQRAILQWLITLEKFPKVIHCHDHHTGLIPFMLQHCPEFSVLKKVPSVFTIHNGEYPGSFDWELVNLLPLFDGRVGGLLDWDQQINPLATGIKCCWKLTTVSPGYLEELQIYTKGLSHLLQQEMPKSHGILNGIDTQVWNPATDTYLAHPLKKSARVFKATNKKWLCTHFNVPPTLPLITFIGRLAREKGADFLAPTIEHYLSSGGKAAFIVLGTGDPTLHKILSDLGEKYKGIIAIALEYNEQLAHQLYAGSDFIWMPSRVEPCGLNQLYAMRYGTIPIVRAIGGLKDTVVDISNPNGSGIQFNQLSLADTTQAIQRAVSLYNNKEAFAFIREAIMDLNFSWEKSAEDYFSLYKKIARFQEFDD